MSKNDRIKLVIMNSIEEINRQLENEDQLEKSPNTILFGNGGVLDSLGLVNFIVIVEQNIENEFDATITLADERAMSQKHSPFMTIESLEDYIEILLEKELNG